MIVFEDEFYKVVAKPFGEYQTNCYLVLSKEKEESLIIDPGIGASQWVLENAKNPLAILNTHGHFDHVWSNAELKEKLPNTPLLCPLEDAFMLKSDCFGTGLTESKADILVGAKADESPTESTANTANLKRENNYYFGDFEVKFVCYPGHTPGCSVIIISHKKSKQKTMFSGDFIFYRSIGRSDFPYSDSATMKASLEAFLENDEDMPVFPGHGKQTSIKQEQTNIPYWLMRI